MKLQNLYQKHKSLCDIPFMSKWDLSSSFYGTHCYDWPPKYFVLFRRVRKIERSDH